MRYDKFSAPLAVFFAVMLIVGLVSCSDDDDNGANSTGGNSDPNTIEISNFAFAPDAVNVSAGTTITWVNRDAVAHTVVSDDGSFAASANLSQGETYEVTFSNPGTYPYHCSIHPSMTATITVTQ